MNSLIGHKKSDVPCFALSLHLLSDLGLIGMICAMCGASCRNPLRWHALGCSLGMLPLCFGAGTAE
jgi:hypothetical protein